MPVKFHEFRVALPPWAPDRAHRHQPMPPAVGAPLTPSRLVLLDDLRDDARRELDDER